MECVLWKVSCGMCLAECVLWKVSCGMCLVESVLWNVSCGMCLAEFFDAPCYLDKLPYYPPIMSYKSILYGTWLYMVNIASR